MSYRSLRTPLLLGLILTAGIPTSDALALLASAPAVLPVGSNQSGQSASDSEPAAQEPTPVPIPEPKPATLGATAIAPPQAPSAGEAEKAVQDQAAEEQAAADKAAKDKKRKADQASKRKKEKSSKRKEDLAEKRKAFDEKSRHLRYAQVELKIAVEGMEIGQAKSVAEGKSARHKLLVAEGKLQQFTLFDQPLEQQTQKLAVDKSKRRVQEAREELDGILAIYAEEEQAMARDAVVGRHKKRLEFAERELELTRFKSRRVLEGELVAKARDMNFEIEEARAGVQRQEREGRKDLQSSELDVLRKEDELEVLGEEVQDLQQAIDKLESKG
ncbi:MAG: hypothetical protein ACI841_003054 [Planctomycetota bacterium]|jgi:hypothetical protein